MEGGCGGRAAGRSGAVRPVARHGRYDLEFLARIDQKSLSWVFRASDEQNYHLATISISPQGRTFTRSSVIEDAPGLSVTTPVRQVGNPKSAITILTKVRGNDFTVSIDGETIERWSDNRLAIGGVGFLGAPEKRARFVLGSSGDGRIRPVRSLKK